MAREQCVGGGPGLQKREGELRVRSREETLVGELDDAMDGIDERGTFDWQLGLGLDQHTDERGERRRKSLGRSATSGWTTKTSWRLGVTHCVAHRKRRHPCGESVESVRPRAGIGFQHSGGRY